MWRKASRRLSFSSAGLEVINKVFCCRNGCSQVVRSPLRCNEICDCKSSSSFSTTSLNVASDFLIYRNAIKFNVVVNSFRRFARRYVLMTTMLCSHQFGSVSASSPPQAIFPHHLGHLGVIRTTRAFSYLRTQQYGQVRFGKSKNTGSTHPIRVTGSAPTPPPLPVSPSRWYSSSKFFLRTGPGLKGQCSLNGY